MTDGESLDSGRERNAVIRSEGPDAARMDFINGLLGFGHARKNPLRPDNSRGRNVDRR